MKQILIVACLVLGCIACTQNTNNNRTDNRTDSLKVATPDTHTAANSLDYWGTYKGTLPSASGSGIETTLTLRKDMTYTLKTVYLGKDDNQFEEKGDYTIDDNVVTLKGLTDGDRYFRVQENQILQLDLDRQIITGDHAEYYVLKKQ